MSVNSDLCTSGVIGIQQLFGSVRIYCCFPCLSFLKSKLVQPNLFSSGPYCFIEGAFCSLTKISVGTCGLIFQNNYEEAVKESTKALELEPNYVKALVRRAQAAEKLEKYEDALAGMF